MSAPCAPKDAPKKGTAHQKAAPRGATEPQLHQMKQAVQSAKDAGKPHLHISATNFFQTFCSNNEVGSQKSTNCG